MLENRLVSTASAASCEPPSIQMKLLELPVLASDPAHRAGDRAHHHRLSFDHVLAEPHACEQRPVGDAGRGEQTIALHQVADLILLARVLDAHFPGPLALFFGVEHEPTLHLAADAAQRRGGQHSFGRSANAYINVDAGVGGIGGGGYTPDRAPAGETDPGAPPAPPPR